MGFGGRDFVFLEFQVFFRKLGWWFFGGVLIINWVLFFICGDLITHFTPMYLGF